MLFRPILNLVRSFMKLPTRCSKAPDTAKASPDQKLEGNEKGPYTCRYNYHPEIEVIINLQINIEQQAALDYLAMAVHFGHPNVARPGCYNFFMNMYEEETAHMLSFVRYQLTRGGVVQLAALQGRNYGQNFTMLNAFKTSLCMEHCVTEKLEKVVTEAIAANDTQCSDFITSEFLEEQMKSIQEMATHLTVVHELSDSLPALHQYDTELLKRYPYAVGDKLKSILL